MVPSSFVRLSRISCCSAALSKSSSAAASSMALSTSLKRFIIVRTFVIRSFLVRPSSTGAGAGGGACSLSPASSTSVAFSSKPISAIRSFQPPYFEPSDLPSSVYNLIWKSKTSAPTPRTVLLSAESPQKFSFVSRRCLIFSLSTFIFWAPSTFSSSSATLRVSASASSSFLSSVSADFFFSAASPSISSSTCCKRDVESLISLEALEAALKSRLFAAVCLSSSNSGIFLDNISFSLSRSAKWDVAAFKRTLASLTAASHLTTSACIWARSTSSSSSSAIPSLELISSVKSSDKDNSSLRDFIKASWANMASECDWTMSSWASFCFWWAACSASHSALFDSRRVSFLVTRSSCLENLTLTFVMESSRPYISVRRPAASSCLACICRRSSSISSSILSSFSFVWLRSSSYAPVSSRMAFSSSFRSAEINSSSRSKFWRSWAMRSWSAESCFEMEANFLRDSSPSLISSESFSFFCISWSCIDRFEKHLATPSTTNALWLSNSSSAFVIFSNTLATSLRSRLCASTTWPSWSASS